MILSILICTIPERLAMYQALYSVIEKQIALVGAFSEVEVLTDERTNLPTGTKRNYLLSIAKGEFVVFIDDDDEIHEHYVPIILETIKNNPQVDCIGMRGWVSFDGEKPKNWSISIQHGYWHETDEEYKRTPNHISPVKRNIAIQGKFPEISYGEDLEYSKRIFPLLKTEAFIDKLMYHYKYVTNK